MSLAVATSWREQVTQSSVELSGNEPEVRKTVLVSFILFKSTMEPNMS